MKIFGAPSERVLEKFLTQFAECTKILTFCSFILMCEEHERVRKYILYIWIFGSQLNQVEYSQTNLLMEGRCKLQCRGLLQSIKWRIKHLSVAVDKSQSFSLAVWTLEQINTLGKKNVEKQLVWTYSNNIMATCQLCKQIICYFRQYANSEKGDNSCCCLSWCGRGTAG